jgi:hypothetical protein
VYFGNEIIVDTRNLLKWQDFKSGSRLPFYFAWNMNKIVLIYRDDGQRIVAGYSVQPNSGTYRSARSFMPTHPIACKTGG